MPGTLDALLLDRFPRQPDSHSANTARFYDAMLGGKDHFDADRNLARSVIAGAPAMRRVPHQHPRFVKRAVRHMVNQGITQFLDLGCGLPAADSPHYVARRRDPRARMVYVDHDPIVVAHGRARLADNSGTAVAQADIRDPYGVLNAAETRWLIDLSRPVGILLTSVLHHIHQSDDPHGLVRSYVAKVPSGSMVALSHFHAPLSNGRLAEQARRTERLLVAELGSGWFRTRPTIASFFDGLVPDAQGLCSLAQWSSTPSKVTRHARIPTLALCGMAHKP